MCGVIRWLCGPGQALPPAIANAMSRTVSGWRLCGLVHITTVAVPDILPISRNRPELSKHGKMDGIPSAEARRGVAVPNRLAASTSPYLLQHKDNPVDWFEWGDEAFA